VLVCTSVHLFLPLGLQLCRAGAEAVQDGRVPRLRVKKERTGSVGLAPDHVDHEHPDIHAPIVDGRAGKGRSRSTVEAGRQRFGDGKRTLM